MNRRSLAILLLGFWMGGTLFMWAVATQNFALVNDVLAAPSDEFAGAADGLSAEELRLVMRYQASEANRLFFEGWGWVQIPIALAVAGLAWPASLDSRFVRIASIAMLAITAFLSLWVVPETVRLGRLIDFAPRGGGSPEETSFWRLHHTYTGLDMVKFLLALTCGFLLARRAKSSA